MKPKQVVVLFCFSAMMAMSLVARAPGEFSPPARTFQLTYHLNPA